MSRTRQQLRDAVRMRISDVAATNTDNWTDAQVNSFLYSAVLFVQAEIEKLDQHYFEEELDVALTSTDTTITLPAGFRILIDLRRVDNNNNIPFTLIDRRSSQNSTSLNFNNLYNGNAYLAYLRKDSIKYVNALGFDHTARMTYTKDLADLTLDSESWGLQATAEECVIAKTAELLLGSENNKTDYWERQFNMLWQTVINTLSYRQKATPKYVNDRSYNQW